MNAGSPEAREVPVDVLPPLPKDGAQSTLPPQNGETPPPFANLRTFYHPASGVIIVVVGGFSQVCFAMDLLPGPPRFSRLALWTLTISFLSVVIGGIWMGPLVE